MSLSVFERGVLIVAGVSVAACASPESQNGQQEFTAASINALLTEYSSFDIALPNGSLQGAELQNIAVQETKDSPDVLTLKSENGESFTANVASATLVTEEGESTEVLVLVRHQNNDILVLRSEPHPSIDTDGIAHSDGKIAVLNKDKKQLTESASSSFEASFDTTSDTGVIWLTIGNTMFTLSEKSEESVMTKVVALLTQPDDVSAEQPTPTSAAPKNPTEAPDPFATAPEGTTGFDKDGNPIRVVEYENGQKYEFHLNEQGEWVIQVGNFPLIHNGAFEFSSFTISISENVPGGRAIESINHPSTPSIDSNRPLDARVSVMFLDRLGLTSSSPERYVLMNDEMPKGLESKALLPVITSDGDEAEVRFSTETGFKLTIVNASDMEPLFLEGRAIQWFDGHGGTYYLRVTVDENNNAVCMAASKTPLNELTEKKFRNFILSCVSHVLSQKDLREPLNFSNLQVLSNVSEQPIPSTGVQDVEIVFQQ